MSISVALAIFTLTQSAMFGFLESTFLEDQSFCDVCDASELIKNGQGLSKPCSGLINVNKVRLEVMKFDSVDL